MDADENVCLCFQVSLRKIRTYLRSETPEVASQLCDCFGAGTGCGWCVKSLEELHRQWSGGEAEPVLDVTLDEHAAGRRGHQMEKKRLAAEQQARGD